MRNLKPYKTTYDATNAFWMAKFSNLVYTCVDGTTVPDANKIHENLLALNDKFIAVHVFDKNSSQAILIVHEDYLAVAFCGTNEIKDFADNLNVISTQQLFGSFHRGFYQAVMDIWGEIDSLLHSLQAKKTRPIWFAGHSLGGAMATIAASIFINEDRTFSGLYTFGQPRTLKREAARVFNSEAKKRCFRFQNNNDIVSRLPARLMGYSHCGTFVYINEHKQLSNDPGWWYRFVDTVQGVINDIGDIGLDSIKDHSMDEYLDAIAEWNDRAFVDCD